MCSAPAHRAIPADRHQVPRPFRSFAVRSEEPRHADEARAPWAWVHLLHTGLFEGAARAAVVADGLARVQIEPGADIGHALTSFEDLAAQVAPHTSTPPTAALLADRLASALQCTGVLGRGLPAYRHHLVRRLDYLGARGAGFHNDVSRHWPTCLFWVLALAVDDVAFVQPHAGLCLPLAPGDLLVFDPAMAHGLCRPRDGGRFIAASFEGGAADRQLFLTGELELDDAQWAALGSPWLPIGSPVHRGALDLLVAEFDECSGAVQRLRDLRHGMAPRGDVGALDEPPDCAAQAAFSSPWVSM